MADAPRFPHEKALAIALALDRAGIPHAFGGAIALAFAAEPRGTIDVDLNLFVSVARADEVLSTLHPLGVSVGGRLQGPVRPPEGLDRARVHRADAS